MVFAVDFDGTICVDKYPEIGDPRPDAIGFIKQCMAKGHRVILWTCRSGTELDAAVAWCAERGLVFDAVNDNLAENVAIHRNNSRKVSADFYIDDRNLHLGAAFRRIEEDKPC